MRSWSARAGLPARFASAVLAALSAALVLSACGDDGGTAERRSQWSVFEDHTALVRSGTDRRKQILGELEELGADTLRIEFKWNELAPAPLARRKPSFDATDPAAYPGFDPYDDLVRRASRKGFRILADLAPEAPRWATGGGHGKSPGNANLRPIPAEFGKFAAAVAKRYSGTFRELPRVDWFSLWNEPNHALFLKPLPEGPSIYRGLVEAGIPAVRQNAARGAKVLVGETAPSGRLRTAMGPAEFIRKWLCLDSAFHAIDKGTCAGYEKLDVDGYAHHPYGAIDVVPPGDVVNLLAIRRLGDYLDRAAEAGRLPEDLPVYDTEFGLQSNPPDPTVSTTLEEQAQFLNEKEELSYRYPRLRSYAQYLLFDDPVRPGPRRIAWSGFQTGLRFNEGEVKPSWNAYRLPIVAHLSGGGVDIWGRVRPGRGVRSVQLQRLQLGRWVDVGGPISTDRAGYFTAERPEQANYRFEAYRSPGAGKPFATSRAATPLP